MRRVLLYISLFLLLSTAVTSFGWYLSCNKPCDPEIIYKTIEAKADWTRPTYIPTAIDTNPKVPKQGLISKVIHGNHPGKHIVKKDQNLYRISLMYGVPVVDIMAANGLTSTNIEVGQPLIIPNPTTKRDSMYTAQIDTTINGTDVQISTQGPCPPDIISLQFLNKTLQPAWHLYGGVGLNDRRVLSAKGMFIPKKGRVAYTADYSILGEKSFEAGIMYQLK